LIHGSIVAGTDRDDATFELYTERVIS